MIQKTEVFILIILCNMTKDYFIGNKHEKNLHRWSLENREKTKYEKIILGKYLFYYNIMDSIIKQCKDKYFELGPSKIHGIGIINFKNDSKRYFFI